MSEKKFIGIDIGGTKCAAVLGNEQATIIDRRSFQTNSVEGATQVIETLFSLIDELIKQHNWKIEEISSIGISCGGPLDSRNGIIISPPNLPGWNNVPIVSIFEKRYGITTFLQNDANACAIAEWLFGAGKGTQNMIFLTFGTGFGGGLILNGRLYSGTNDMAGEIGHVRIDKTGPVGYGKMGSLEGFCSGGGIAKLAKIVVMEKIKEGIHVSFCPTIESIDNITAKIIGLAAENGDHVAQEILAISGKYLGKGLAILIDILNPEKIVIGSIFVRAYKFLWPYAEMQLKKEALDLAYNHCKVVPAELGESIGDYGSLCVAMYESGHWEKK